MKKYKSLKEQEDAQLNLMKKFFNKRTKNHQNLVKHYGKLIANSPIGKEINPQEFAKEILHHDKSKYEEPEYTPYLYITWKYRCKDKNIPFEVDPEMQGMMDQATILHIRNNKHHPEYWSNQEGNLINTTDRDEPSGSLIDATQMPLTHVATMVADWMGMSHEKNDCPYKWAKKNINVRWKFSPEQEKFIYKILNTIWKNEEI